MFSVLLGVLIGFMLFYYYLVKVYPHVLSFLEVTDWALAGVGKFHFQVAAAGIEVKHLVFDGCANLENFLERMLGRCHLTESLVIVRDRQAYFTRRVHAHARVGEATERNLLNRRAFAKVDGERTVLAIPTGPSEVSVAVHTAQSIGEHIVISHIACHFSPGGFVESHIQRQCLALLLAGAERGGFHHSHLLQVKRLLV